MTPPPSARFHGLISTLTVVIMFYGIVMLVPYIRTQSPLHGASSGFVALLSSVAVYRLLALGLSWLLKKSLLVRAWILGPTFMHGTWVGYFIGHAGDKRYIVEHFQQDLDGLVIVGRSYTEQGDAHAHWSTDATSIDAARGRLIYAYSCDIMSRKVTLQGVGVFQFERQREDTAPTSIAGYVADLLDGKRIPAHEVKASQTLLSWEAALAAAKTHSESM